MKLNRTRKEWRDQIYRRWQPGMQIPQVLADIETLFAEVDRLTAQLAERDKRIDAQNQTIAALLQSNAMDRAQLAEAERNLKYEQHCAGRIGTHGPGCHTWGPRHYECALAQLAEREGIARELAKAVGELLPQNICLSNPNVRDTMVVPTDVSIGELRRAAAALARFHAAEGEG